MFEQQWRDSRQYSAFTRFIDLSGTFLDPLLQRSSSVSDDLCVTSAGGKMVDNRTSRSSQKQEICTPITDYLIEGLSEVRNVDGSSFARIRRSPQALPDTMRSIVDITESGYKNLPPIGHPMPQARRTMYKITTRKPLPEEGVHNGPEWLKEKKKYRYSNFATVNKLHDLQKDDESIVCVTEASESESSEDNGSILGQLTAKLDKMQFDKERKRSLDDDDDVLQSLHLKHTLTKIHRNGIHGETGRLTKVTEDGGMIKIPVYDMILQRERTFNIDFTWSYVKFNGFYLRKPAELLKGCRLVKFDGHFHQDEAQVMESRWYVTHIRCDDIMLKVHDIDFYTNGHPSVPYPKLTAASDSQCCSSIHKSVTKLSPELYRKWCYCHWMHVLNHYIQLKKSEAKGQRKFGSSSGDGLKESRESIEDISKVPFEEVIKYLYNHGKTCN